METTPITLDRDQARELWRAYKTHQHYERPIDEEVRRTYQAIAQGKVVIKALESIVTAGLGPDGLPKLAIARATATNCVLHTWRDGQAVFYDDVSRRQGWRHKITMPLGSFPFDDKRRWESTAMVPMIPIHLRPKRGLANYHILFEAEWSKKVPVDPFLLRRMGKGDLWLVVAAWDLTEVERAALSARVSA